MITPFWIRTSELKQYYTASLNTCEIELRLMFGKDWEKYKSDNKPTLTGFIRYVKAFKIPNAETSILGRKSNKILRVN